MKYWAFAAGEFPVVSEDDMLQKSINESSEPVVGCLGMFNSSMHSDGIPYKPRDGEIGMCLPPGRMGPIKCGWIGTT